ncbi:hypothetical protein ACLOJK_030618 [Asimina triloba]
MDPSDGNKALEIRALNLPRQEKAKRFLQRIVKQVEPITQKHKWTPCPNEMLLGTNVNRGAEIKVRLRDIWTWEFYLYDQVLDTMLHELCHNVYHGHDAHFNKLWDDLRKALFFFPLFFFPVLL